MSDVAIAELVAQFGREANNVLATDRLSLSAAIWSGGSDGRDEIAGRAYPEHHVVSVALTRYLCEPVKDGRGAGARPWRPGCVQVMPAGVVPKGVFEGPWRLLHLYVPHRAMAEALEVAAGALEVVDPLGAEDATLAAAGLALERAMVESGALGRLRFESAALAIIARLGERWSNLASRPQPVRGGLAPWQVKRTQEAMAAALDTPISLDALAEIAGCSPTHFSRAFKQSVGLPPFDWLQERRIERAKELLEENRLPLAEVALAVGFAAQPQFTTAFGKATGVTPGRWRRERRG